VTTDPELPSNDYESPAPAAEFIPPTGPMTDDEAARTSKYAGDFQNLVDGLTDRLKETEAALEAVQIASHLKDREIQNLRNRANKAEQARDELLRDRDLLFRWVRLVTGGGKELLAQVMQPMGGHAQTGSPPRPPQSRIADDGAVALGRKFGADSRA
jgi:hypothetical protein